MPYCKFCIYTHCWHVVNFVFSPIHLQHDTVYKYMTSSMSKLSRFPNLNYQLLKTKIIEKKIFIYLEY